jgi:5-methylcytosine-specific restriction endonuclease McrA
MRKGTLEEQERRDRFTKLRSMFRRAWMRDPERLACIRDSRIEYKGDNKRQKWEYGCKMCHKCFMLKEIVVDHIIPSGTFLCEHDFSTFVPYLFCHRSNLQLLCKACHKIKTNEEREKK